MITHNTFQIRELRRLRCLEWFFLILATCTILGLLAVAVERFVNLHRQFGSFEPGNCTWNESQEIKTGEIQLHNLKQSVWQHEMGDLVDFVETGDHNDSPLPLCDKSCDSWTCTNDFIFAVALVVNLCELLCPEA